jgi:hypothetical protein
MSLPNHMSVIDMTHRMMGFHLNYLTYCHLPRCLVRHLIQMKAPNSLVLA